MIQFEIVFLLCNYFWQGGIIFMAVYLSFLLVSRITHMLLVGKYEKIGLGPTYVGVPLKPTQ